MSFFHKHFLAKAVQEPDINLVPVMDLLTA